MDTGKIGNFEEDYLSLTGAKEKSRRLVINTVKIPVKDKTGKITGIFGLFWDITDRKKAEEDVKALNKQIEYILGATKTGLDIIDSNYNLIYIDPEWKKVYGDPAGKKCYEYFMGRKSVCEGCGLAKAIKTKKIVVSEEILAKEGNRPIQVTSIPFQDEKGNWLVAEVNTDISERKKYEEELRVSERKFRTIFENARDGILVAEPDTKKIRMHNRAISQMLGYSAEELAGLSIMDIHPEKELPHVLQQFERQSMGEITLAKDIPVKRKDGSIFYADINAAVISLDGKKFMVGFFHDITPERVAVIERARAEKMQTAADMKSRLMSTVSHEFRSPLAAIKEGIALVLEGLIGQINPEQKDTLHTAKKNVDRLNRLVENVLTLGKIEAGKMEIVREDSDINQLALETARSIYVLANDKGIDLEIKVDEKIPKISLDSDRITQVITNLLSNAIKFTAQGKVALTTKLESDAVHVTVEDTGPGIEPEDIPKLFDIFETLGGTRLAKGGTGLGLFISKDIISAHKGKIWVESTPGKGSVFHFTLPLKI